MQATIRLLTVRVVFKASTASTGEPRHYGQIRATDTTVSTEEWRPGACLLGRSARCRRGWLSPNDGDSWWRRARHLQLLANHKRNKLPRSETRAHGISNSQHRQLQSNLTCSLCRRSGGSLRCWWRHEFISRSRAYGRHPLMGIQRARNASDFLPSRTQGHS